MLKEGLHINCRVIKHKFLLTQASSARDQTLRLSCRCVIKRGRPARATVKTRSTATDHQSFYAVLGVSLDATLAEVKTAYRRLALKWHPDHATSPAARDTYQAIRDAYDVLSNHTKRHHYNKHGVNGLGPQFHKYERTQGSSSEQHGGQGQNVDAMLGLTFMEAALGTERVFQASVRLQCPDCNGSGLSANSEPLDCVACRGTGQAMRYQNSILGRTKSYGTCPPCGGKGVSSRFWCKRCGGEGRAVTLRHVRVKIPAGVDHGSVLRLNGQGDVGTFGGKRGDILLRFLIHPEDSFTRKGRDIYSTVPISYIDAMLGARLDVQTLRGSSAIQVLPGTQHNSTIKLPGQGVQGWGSTSAPFGSHYVTLHVLIPVECTEKEQQLLEQLQSMTRTASEQSQNRRSRLADDNSNSAAACAA